MRQFRGVCPSAKDRETIVLTAVTELQSHVHISGHTLTLHTEEPGVTAEMLCERLRSSFGIVLSLSELQQPERQEAR